MFEHHDQCFGCGRSNPAGLQLRFERRPDGEVAAALTLSPQHVGPPGLIHGGIIATVLDEALAQLPPALGIAALTRELSIRYRRRVLPNTPLRVLARVRTRDGSTLHLEARLVDENGNVLAESSGAFEQIDPASLGFFPSRN